MDWGSLLAAAVYYVSRYGLRRNACFVVACGIRLLVVVRRVLSLVGVGRAREGHVSVVVGLLVKAEMVSVMVAVVGGGVHLGCVGCVVGPREVLARMGVCCLRGARVGQVVRRARV